MTRTDGPTVDDGLTSRGRRTRVALIEAAREVFERDGFGGRITDIAEGAGVAHGTFYTYFESKEEIFLAVSEQLMLEFFPPVGGGGRSGSHAAHTAIEAANRRYLESYLRHGRLMVLWEEMPGVSPGLGRLIRDARAAIVERNRRAIVRLQLAGVADAGVDARYAAVALGGMVNHFAYHWVSEGVDFEIDAAVTQLTRLWANALRLPVPEGSTE